MFQVLRTFAGSSIFTELNCHSSHIEMGKIDVRRSSVVIVVAVAVAAIPVNQECLCPRHALLTCMNASTINSSLRASLYPPSIHPHTHAHPQKHVFIRIQFQPDSLDTKGYFSGVGSFGNTNSDTPGWKETDGNYK
jgi:hypothetical protein